jgi:hypothetical protein
VVYPTFSLAIVSLAVPRASATESDPHADHDQYRGAQFGYGYLYLALDDNSRRAYNEVPPDEGNGPFLAQARSRYASPSIADRIINNDSC